MNRNFSTFQFSSLPTCFGSKSSDLMYLTLESNGLTEVPSALRGSHMYMRYLFVSSSSSPLLKTFLVSVNVPTFPPPPLLLFHRNLKNNRISMTEDDGEILKGLDGLYSLFVIDSFFAFLCNVLDTLSCFMIRELGGNGIKNLDNLDLSGSPISSLFAIYAYIIRTSKHQNETLFSL